MRNRLLGRKGFFISPYPFSLVYPASMEKETYELEGLGNKGFAFRRFRNCRCFPLACNGRVDGPAELEA